MKKAIANYLMIIWSWIIFIGLSIFFFILFMVATKGCAHNVALQSITSDYSDQAQADIFFINFLRTPMEFDINEDGTPDSADLGDLVERYCSLPAGLSKDSYKTQLLLKSIDLMFPHLRVAELQCQNHDKLQLWGVLCKKPSSIYIPTPNGPIQIDYCTGPAATDSGFTTPDGAHWIPIVSLTGPVVWTQKGTEELMTLAQLQEKYAFYEFSDEYKKEVKTFLDAIKNAKTNDEIPTPHGAIWLKTGDDQWCLVVPHKDAGRISCEANLHTEAEVLAAKGKIPAGAGFNTVPTKPSKTPPQDLPQPEPPEPTGFAAQVRKTPVGETLTSEDGFVWQKKEHGWVLTKDLNPNAAIGEELEYNSKTDDQLIACNAEFNRCFT